MDKIMNIMSDLMTVTASLSSCNLNTITDVAAYCYHDGKNICTAEMIAANLQKNLFLVMAKMTDISQLIIQGVPKDPETAYAFGTQAGMDIGSLVRVMLGFHQ